MRLLPILRIEIWSYVWEKEQEMEKKYLKYIPKTLQEDFVDNRVIPFIGAGFSKNGIVPDGTSIPEWDELGKRIATYIPNYSFTNAIDALSLFESEYSRTKLIEILAKELKINQIKAGKTHRAFCDLYFDTICTTNFDFLIEQTLNEKSIPFSTIVSEDRLPISTHEKTKLVKLHGDFNHPERMVITENDYDNFIDKNKVFSTYISNLFITKTLLLIGYSFEDNDIRTLWQIIGSRLGKLRTPAYVVLVDANPIEISRFERRNIKVINIQGNKKNYPEILTEFFAEIKELIDEKIPEQMIITNEKATEELKIPKENNRLCFISAPYQRISFLKELLYPILKKKGISPISLDETIMPGELITRKVDTLITKCSMVVVDLSGNNANVMWELGNAMSKAKNVVLIVDKEQAGNLPSNLSGLFYLTYSFSEDNFEFVDSLERYLNEIQDKNEYVDGIQNYHRLLEKEEYEAAVIMAFRYLETLLTDVSSPKPVPFSMILSSLYTENEEFKTVISETKQYRQIRNRIVHGSVNLSKEEAINIIKNIDEVCKGIKSGDVEIKKES